MDDLISRQAAIDELIAMQEHIESRMSVVGITAYEMAIEALREPEIVRCKDCRWWERESICEGHCLEMDLHHFDEDHYCGFAERRTDEGSD